MIPIFSTQGFAYHKHARMFVAERSQLGDFDLSEIKKPFPTLPTSFWLRSHKTKVELMFYMVGQERHKDETIKSLSYNSSRLDIDDTPMFSALIFNN